MTPPATTTGAPGPAAPVVDDGSPVPVQAARLLQLAQRTADEAVAEARAEAALVLARAGERAAALEEEAGRRARAVEQAARDERDRLQAEIDLLESSRTQVRTHVEQLTALLTDVLDRTGQPGPAAAGDAPAQEQEQAPEQEEAPVSIYEQLGREHGIATAVQHFYERVVADPQLAPYFTGTDMTTLRRHQTALLVQVTGGPVQYEGRDLAKAHAGLGITGEDFDRVVGHLAGTLTDLGVPADVVGTVGGALVAHRDEIVEQPVAG